MERARIRGTRLILIATVALGGCALTIDGPAAARPRGVRPSCDSSKGFVATDAIIGSLFGVASLVALGADAGERALLPGAIGAGFILSAVSGNGRANDCRAAIAEYEAAARSRQVIDDDTEVARRPAPSRSRGAGATVAPGAGPGLAPPPGVASAPSPGTAAPPTAAPPVAAPPVTTTPSATAPPAAAPPDTAPGKPAPRPAPRTSSDPWIDFWKELP